MPGSKSSHLFGKPPELEGNREIGGHCRSVALTTCIDNEIRDIGIAGIERIQWAFDIKVNCACLGEVDPLVVRIPRDSR